jgi:hypothetical protein
MSTKIFDQIIATATDTTGRTLPPNIARICASAGLAVPATGKLTIAAVNRALAGKGISERLWIKNALAAAGLL